MPFARTAHTTTVLRPASAQNGSKAYEATSGWTEIGNAGSNYMTRPEVKVWIIVIESARKFTYSQGNGSSVRRIAYAQHNFSGVAVWPTRCHAIFSRSLEAIFSE